MSYESLILTLKEKNKELKKLENFKKKIEERYKDLIKEKKALQKEKNVLEDFAKFVIPSTKLQGAVDSDGKFSDVELLKKAWTDVKNPYDETS